MKCSICKYKFELIPTIITLPAFIILLFLGSWQLFRLQEKTEWIKNTEIQKAAIISIDDINPLNLSNYEYSRVKITGRFLYHKELFIYAPNALFNQGNGFFLLTPFRMQDGRVVMVDRGWIPAKFRPQARRLQTLIPKEVELKGVVRSSWKPGFMTPDNEVVNNNWFYVDIAQMSDFLKEDLLPFYIQRLRVNEKEDIPYGADGEILVRNNHLQYAITWYLCAIALIVIFLLYHKNRQEDV